MEIIILIRGKSMSYSSYGKSQLFFMGKLTISMAMFNCKLLNHYRVVSDGLKNHQFSRSSHGAEKKLTDGVGSPAAQLMVFSVRLPVFQRCINTIWS